MAPAGALSRRQAVIRLHRNSCRQCTGLIVAEHWAPESRTIFGELERSGVSAEQATALREALASYYSRSDSDLARRECLTILAQSGDRGLRDDLLRELQLHFEIHRAVSSGLYQLLLALQDIGERPFPPNTSSTSIDYVQQNVEAAEAFLALHGYRTPL